jgi:hypothetical protein
METLTVPQLAVPTTSAAMALVNRWLHREVGMAVHATVAHFDATTFCWHLPIELAYATHGTLGVVGDVYLHAATTLLSVWSVTCSAIRQRPMLL